MPEPVIVVPYDSGWPKKYENEKHLILSVAGDLLKAIEHIGSTSISGLGAKPIIDILAGVDDLDIALECVAPLAGIGYEYRSETNPSIPERRYFRKGKPRLFHLHMCEYKGSFWYKHILFRDYLREHPEVAAEYFELKKRLAEKYGRDRIGYTEAKADFIERITEIAREG